MNQFNTKNHKPLFSVVLNFLIQNRDWLPSNPPSSGRSLALVFSWWRSFRAQGTGAFADSFGETSAMHWLRGTGAADSGPIGGPKKQRQNGSKGHGDDGFNVFFFEFLLRSLRKMMQFDELFSSLKAPTCHNLISKLIMIQVDHVMKTTFGLKSKPSKALFVFKSIYGNVV